jgi:hypothetical protein
VLLLAIIAAVIAVLVYRKKLAKSNLRNSQLQHSIRTMSIRNMPMQDRDGSTRSSHSFHGMYDHVPMVEREAALRQSQHSSRQLCQSARFRDKRHCVYGNFMPARWRRARAVLLLRRKWRPTDELHLLLAL